MAGENLGGCERNIDSLVENLLTGDKIPYMEEETGKFTVPSSGFFLCLPHPCVSFRDIG